MAKSGTASPIIAIVRATAFDTVSRSVVIMRAIRRADGVLLGRLFRVAEFATLEWVDWFNNRRLLEPIGNIPPAGAEMPYYAQPDEHAMAA